MKNTRNSNFEVLIVEDDACKLARIVDELASHASSGVTIHTERTSNGARRFLTNHAVDLLVLDIAIPLLDDSVPRPEEGITLLREIHGRTTYKIPLRTIALSAYRELYEQNRSVFDQFSVNVIEYDPVSSDWAARLRTAISTIVTALQERNGGSRCDCDVLLLSALRDPEFLAIQDLAMDWSPPNYLNCNSTIISGRFTSNGRQYSAIASHALKMGTLPSALLAYELVSRFRPKLVIMVGICAGRKAKVDLGSVVAAQSSWDWQSGRIEISNGKVCHRQRPDFYPVLNEIDRCVEDVAAMSSELVNIWQNWRGLRPTAPTSLVRGPMASGSAVISAAAAIDRIVEQHQGVIAFDMETYGIYYACSVSPEKPMFLSLKGVCDFGDEAKDSTIQPYAAYASARVCDLLLRQHGRRLLG